MLGSVRDDAEHSGVTPPGHFSAYVVTSDPDALCARALSARRPGDPGAARH